MALSTIRKYWTRKNVITNDVLDKNLFLFVKVKDESQPTETSLDTSNSIDVLF